MRHEILAYLYRCEGEYVSGQEIAESLGITRVAVWKNIEALKEEGYDIEAVSRKGYILHNEKEIVVPKAVKARLKTQIFGRNIICYPEIDSTNEEAKRKLAANEIEEGTVIIAQKQTAGRGRMRRRWESPKGGLWFSLVLSPGLPVNELALLSLVFACSAARSLSRFLPEPCLIKWPNDIYAGNKKVAGILLELAGELDFTSYLVAGMGINVNIREEDMPPELREISTSLYMQSGLKHDINQVLINVLQDMECYYKDFLQNGFEKILEEFKAGCMHLNRKVKVKRGDKYIEGVNVDIDFMGNMVINTGDEIVRVSTGDVSIIRA